MTNGTAQWLAVMGTSPPASPPAECWGWFQPLPIWPRLVGAAKAERSVPGWRCVTFLAAFSLFGLSLCLLRFLLHSGGGGVYMWAWGCARTGNSRPEAWGVSQ